MCIIVPFDLSFMYKDIYLLLNKLKYTFFFTSLFDCPPIGTTPPPLPSDNQ